MTNLAIKGILGIEAMHQISQALGKPDDAGYFAVGFPIELMSMT